MLLLDRLHSRLEPGEAIGAEIATVGEDGDLVSRARDWAGPDGPEAVFEATGVPELVQSAAELVSPAGRVVVVGLSSRNTPLRVGDLAFKELDMLGVSCCQGNEFAEAVDLVARRRDAVAGLLTHEFSLEQAPEAIEYALEHPAEVMKAVVRLDPR